jgi:hypothetical protein
MCYANKICEHFYVERTLKQQMCLLISHSKLLTTTQNNKNSNAFLLGAEEFWKKNKGLRIKSMANWSLIDN